jgi:integrase
MPVRWDDRKQWGYEFELPGSTRTNRKRAYKWNFKREKDAIKAEAERRIEEDAKAEAAARGIAVLPRTLGQLLDEFLEQHVKPRKDAAGRTSGLSPKTYEDYKQWLSKVGAPLRALPVAEVTTLHLTREWNRIKDEGGRHLITKQARPVSSQTVRLVKSVVSRAFRWGVSQGLAAVNPVRDSEVPRGGKTRETLALTPQQQRTLIDAAMDSDVLDVKAGLGIRRSEVGAIQWPDIEGNQITIQRSLIWTSNPPQWYLKETKRPSSRRTITAPASVMRVFEKVRAEQAKFREQFGPDYRTDLNLVFCEEDGSPLRLDRLTLMVTELRKKLKMPAGVTLHTLRHSHGSQLLKGGMELPAVSKRLGHSSPAVTAKIYSHMLDGRDEVAADLWERLNASEEDQKNVLEN